MNSKQYNLAFPLEIEPAKMEILKELAGRVDSAVQIKGKGQSAPVHIIVFDGSHDEHIEDICEIFSLLGIPFNMREITGADLVRAYIFRPGMESALIISPDDDHSDDRHDALDRAVSLEMSYEGVVLAGIDSLAAQESGLRH